MLTLFIACFESDLPMTNVRIKNPFELRVVVAIVFRCLKISIVNVNVQYYQKARSVLYNQWFYQTKFTESLAISLLFDNLVLRYSYITKDDVHDIVESNFTLRRANRKTNRRAAGDPIIKCPCRLFRADGIKGKTRQNLNFICITSKQIHIPKFKSISQRTTEESPKNWIIKGQ